MRLICERATALTDNRSCGSSPILVPNFFNDFLGRLSQLYSRILPMVLKVKKSVRHSLFKSIFQEDFKNALDEKIDMFFRYLTDF